MDKELAANTNLSHYRILQKIGAGGMGEVYLAEDIRLDRKVAIKFLPADFAADEDRVCRFEQEARATSSLNHPNILTVYDIGRHEGSSFIVAELLEGEELRERLNDGAMGQRKAIDYACQIVAGLGAAHERGIVHRDLKPENIFITKDERVKILDFGLAKLKPSTFDGAGSEDETRKPLTNPGVVMGTVGYMSPEQVRGAAVDHRSDIFSFGVILYEMLCGNKPFTGDSVVETLNAILKEDAPELDCAARKISPALEKIMRRCLEKKPEHRFHSAHDLGFALEALSASSASSGSGLTSAASAAVVKPARSAWRGRIPWLVAGLLLAALLAALPFAVMYLRQGTRINPVRVSVLIEPPEKSTGFQQMELSPDGRNLVFLTTFDGKTQLWLRPMDSFAAHPLAGTEGAAGFPFWSPDSRSIAFATGGKLKRIDLGDGTVQNICDLQLDIRGVGGDWNRDGTILFFTGASGILQIPATGGAEPKQVPGVENREPETLHRWVKFLPDGRHFLYSSSSPKETSEIFVGSLDGGEPKKLLSAQSNAIYAESPDGAGGYLLFCRNGALLAQSFDARSLIVSGEPVRIADQIRVSLNMRAFMTASSNGTLVYDPNPVSENRALTWFERTGKEAGTLGTPGTYQRVRLSPDQKYAAVYRRDLNGASSIEVIDIARGAAARITSSGTNDLPDLVWSPDGSRIAWSVRQDSAVEIRQKLASGAGQEELLLRSDMTVGPTDWSPDGKFILYTGIDPKTKNDLWLLPLEGERQPGLFFQTPAGDQRASFSPDGRFIAYDSGESGRSEVYVQTFPPSAGKWLISTGGGSNVRWRRDGRELFYTTPDGKMMSVEMMPAGGAFEPGVPKQLFELNAARTAPATAYDVSADGQRFLFISRQADAPSTYAVVVNWTADLKK